MNTKKIVIIIYNVPTENDLQRTGYNELKIKGFSVSIWSCFELFNQVPITLKPLKGVDVRFIKSYEQLNDLLSIHRTNTIFLDNIVGFRFDDFKFHHLLRLLRNNNIALFFVSDLSSPISQLNKNKIPLFGKFSQVLKKIQEKKIAGILSFSVRIFFRFFIRYSDYYPKHKTIFSNKSEALDYFLDTYKFNADHVIPIHSYDYDLYLDKRMNNNCNLDSYSNICVFLDVAATHHIDNAFCDLENADEHYYYKTMNVLFNWIEEKTRLKVVIAAHPRSNYSKHDECFGGRSIIYGKTIELVRKCKFVLSHYSSSINYAVIYKKPAIFLQIKGVSDLHVKFLSSHLGSTSLDLNGDAWKEYDINKLLRINEDQYENYLYTFIKSRNIGDKGTWDIVEPYLIKELEIMSHQNLLV